MKKLSLVLIPILIGVVFFVGCGKNEKKTSLLTGTTTTSSYTNSPMASSVVALFRSSQSGSTGANSGSTQSPALVGTIMPQLGEADVNGEYTFTDPMGMTVKMKFKKGSDIVYYFNMAGTFDTSVTPWSLYLYVSSQSLSVSKIHASEVNQNTSFPRYVPSIFCKLTDNTPIAWLTVVNLSGMSTLAADLKTFIESNFPDSLAVNVTGSIPNGTISLALTTSMTQKPTADKPAHMTGTGTITLNNGVTLTLNSIDVYIGPNGPQSGSQTFTASTGETGTMTFNADGSMDGKITKDGVVIATVHINADGTGTYTDLTTNQTYSITAA